MKDKKSVMEVYIDKAIEKARSEFSGTKISDVSIVMHNEADGATKILAEALLAQAEANQANSNAIMQLAKTLKPIDISAIKIGGDK